MRKICIPIIFLCSACQYAQCIHKYDIDGITVCLMTTGDVDFDIIEEVITIVEEESSSYFPEVIDFRDELGRINFTIVIIQDDSFFATECQDFYLGTNGEPIFPMAKSCRHTASGLTSPEGKAIAITRTPCIANSILSHELIHVVQYLYLGGVDKNNQHPAPLFTTSGREVTTSVEGRASKRASLICDGEIK